MFCIYYHEQNISALYLQLWLLSNVVRKQASHENGAVTYNPGKNRLVEIPTTGGKQSDNGLTEIQYTSQMWTVNFQHYGCLKNGVLLFLAKTAVSNLQMKISTTTKVMLFCA